MPSTATVDYIMDCVEHYKEFMGIIEFPEFSIESKGTEFILGSGYGYYAPVVSMYDVSSGKHTLYI